MFKNIARAARPAFLASRSLGAQPTRAFSTSLRASSGGPAPPQIYGSGGKAGNVPTDIDQATGLDRLQVLGEVEGIDVFDESPLDASRIGTKVEPVLVQSYDVERIVGCTGVPADSHDILWFNLRKDKQARCTECGSVYALDFQGEEHHAHDHAHH